MEKEKIKIVFVCHGNICRSPMAEYIFKYLIKLEGLEDKFFVTSKALSNEEIGNDIYGPAKRVLTQHKIPFDFHSASRLTKEDISYYDHIILMDTYNQRLYNMQFNPSDKVKKLLFYLGTNDDVSDPWYHDNFEECYSLIYKGASSFLQTLKSIYKL